MSSASIAVPAFVLPALPRPVPLRAIGRAALLAVQSLGMAGLLWLTLALPGFAEQPARPHAVSVSQMRR